MTERKTPDTHPPIEVPIPNIALIDDTTIIKRLKPPEIREGKLLLQPNQYIVLSRVIEKPDEDERENYIYPLLAGAIELDEAEITALISNQAVQYEAADRILRFVAAGICMMTDYQRLARNGVEPMLMMAYYKKLASTAATHFLFRSIQAAKPLSTNKAIKIDSGDIEEKPQAEAYISKHELTNPIADVSWAMLDIFPLSQINEAPRYEESKASLGKYVLARPLRPDSIVQLYLPEGMLGFQGAGRIGVQEVDSITKHHYKKEPGYHERDDYNPTPNFHVENVHLVSVPIRCL